MALSNSRNFFKGNPYLGIYYRAQAELAAHPELAKYYKNTADYVWCQFCKHYLAKAKAARESAIESRLSYPFQTVAEIYAKRAEEAAQQAASVEPSKELEEKDEKKSEDEKKAKALSIIAYLQERLQPGSFEASGPFALLLESFLSLFPEHRAGFHQDLLAQSKLWKELQVQSAITLEDLLQKAIKDTRGYDSKTLAFIVDAFSTFLAQGGTYKLEEGQFKRVMEQLLQILSRGWYYARHSAEVDQENCKGLLSKLLLSIPLHSLDQRLADLCELCLPDKNASLIKAELFCIALAYQEKTSPLNAALLQEDFPKEISDLVVKYAVGGPSP